MQIWGCLSVSVILLYIWSTSIKSDMCATFKSSNPNTNWCQLTWKGIWIKTDHICTSLKFSVSSFRQLPVCTNATITFDFYFSLGITNKWLKSYHTNVLNVYSFDWDCGDVVCKAVSVQQQSVFSAFVFLYMELVSPFWMPDTLWAPSSTSEPAGNGSVRPEQSWSPKGTGPKHLQHSNLDWLHTGQSQCQSCTAGWNPASDYFSSIT